MTVKETLLEWVFPTECFLCRRPTGGDPLCASCREKWNRCVSQGRNSELHTLRGVDHLCYLARYSVNDADPVSAFLRRAKRDYRKKAVAFAAESASVCITDSLHAVWRDLVVVPVPRSDKAIRKFGFDQAALLSRGIARELGAQYLNAINHIGNRKQKTLNRAERAENAMHAYCVRTDAHAFVYGRHILLVDDVVTTGATMTACACLLREAGAQTVDAFAMARTPH